MTLHITRKLPHQIDRAAHDVTLITGPLFHIGGMTTVMRAVMVGDTLVLEGEALVKVPGKPEGY